jgi:hypothetical protein
VSFDPFNPADPSLAASMPLFVLIIAVAMLGVVAGGCATWIGQRHWRRAARRHQAEAQTARAEFADFKAAALSAQAGSQRLPVPVESGLYGPYGRDKQGAAL